VLGVFSSVYRGSIRLRSHSQQWFARRLGLRETRRWSAGESSSLQYLEVSYLLTVIRYSEVENSKSSSARIRWS
jgi:hypothetical protein